MNLLTALLAKKWHMLYFHRINLRLDRKCTLSSLIKTALLSLAASTLFFLVGCGGASSTTMADSSSEPLPETNIDNQEQATNTDTETTAPEPITEEVVDSGTGDPAIVETTYQIAGTYCSCGLTSEKASSINRDTEGLDYLDGVLVRISWTNLNPQVGIYDWSYIDEQIEYANTRGIKITLAVMNGPYAPKWLADEGAIFIDYVIRNDSRSLPLPWDEVYLSYYKEFIAALGERYKDSDTIALIHMTNATTNGFEMQYNFSTEKEAEFQSTGYSESALIDSWKGVIDAFANAFPSTPIDIEVHPVFFSDEVPDQVVDYGLKTYGKQFGVFAAWWSEHNAMNVYTGAYSLIQRAQQESFASLQMVSAVDVGSNPITTAEFTAALELAISNGIYYIEIWNADLINSDLDTLILEHDSIVEDFKASSAE